MVNPGSTQQQLAELASFLMSRKDEILADWRSLCEQDVLLPTASGLSWDEFKDRVPDLLAVMGQRLRQESVPVEPANIAREHGLQRWRLGYTLQELLTEIAHLHATLTQQAQAFWVAYPLTEAITLLQAEQIINQLIHEAIHGSVLQYSDLQKLGAAERAADLQHTLDEVNDLMRRRGYLLRMASHDLKGSFGVLRGAAYILDQPDNTEQERTEMLQMLQRNLSKVTSMLTQLMDLARLEAGQETLYLETFDAAELLRRVAESVQPMANDQGLLLLTDGPDQLIVRGDSVKIQRIVQNLLLNALKYTIDGGVTLSWALDGLARWQFTVEDTGPGLPHPSGMPMPAISPENLADALRSQINSPIGVYPETQSGGEGIGLHIVRRLCDLLTAKMDIETKPGMGTTFRIQLPITYDNKPTRK